MGETHSTNRKKKEKTVSKKPGQKEETKTDTVDFQISAGDFVKSKNTQFRNEYKVGEMLGSGAFGEVRKVTHKATGLVRAAKILKKDALDSEEKAKMVEEVRILTTLDHPHIMRIYEMFEDSRFYYIISEFLEGGELFDRIIQNSRFSEKDAASIMQQILSAIAYCHKHNIVHRDIKPENLVYESKSEDANLKLIDFGTAKIFKSEEALRETHGTPYYIAPEILSKNYTEKCDVWSCGVVMYILLSGLPPFNGSSDQNILKRVKLGKYDFNNKIWGTISNEAKHLISRMLEFNPSKRCSAQDALNDPWFQSAMQKKEVNQPLARETLVNLQKFGFESKLQEATWVFLVSYFATKEEKEDLLETFKALDIDHDGQLTKDELIKGYMSIMGMSANQAKEEAEAVMKSIDTNKSGSIDYTEFVNATISKNHLLKNERLQAAFKVFDRNGDGVISADEMRFLFNEGKTHGIPEDIWGKWISQVDKNSDGGISFEEFKEMMISLMAKS